MSRHLRQIIRFGIVGSSAFLLDYAILWTLTEFFDVWYILSACISFSISVIFNYYASVRFVFRPSRKMCAKTQLVCFFVLSAFGLAINEVGMWIGVEYIGVHYMFAKIAMTSIVMVFNYITRKVIFEKT